MPLRVVWVMVLVTSRIRGISLRYSARKGQIIPVRLTGQLEAIGQALDKAAEEEAAAVPAAAPDLDTYKHELGAMLTHGFHDLRLPLTSIRGYSDMLGNAAEWVRSAYAPYPYADGDGRNAAGAAGPRVVRGGSWRDRPSRCRSAQRLSYPSWRKVYNVGFRDRKSVV